MTTPPPSAPRDAPRRSVARPVIAVVVAALLAMWGYVVYLAVFEGRADSPDRIADTSFTDAAEDRCASALSRIGQLPRAETQRDDPLGRADTVETANELYRGMLDDLERMPVEGTDDAALVEEWLADWRVLLGDRVDFVARLRADPEARMLVTAGPSGRQITLRIDEFAVTNDMPSCRAPVDA